MLTTPTTDRRVLADVWDTNLRSRHRLYVKVVAGVATRADVSALRKLERVHRWLLSQVAS